MVREQLVPHGALPVLEVDLDLADRRGVLVVSESACVGLSFGDEPEWVRKRQANAEKRA